MPDARPLVVGVAGGVASGKSTVSRLLAGAGGEVVDADAIVRELERAPAVVERIERALGASLREPGGALDRAATAKLVFADAAKLRALEQVLHPLVGERIRERIDALRARGNEAPAIVVLDVPLLFESGFARECDRIVFVEVPKDRRAERARAERGWGAGEVARREARQGSLEEKRARADVVVRNEGSLEALSAAVAAARARLLASAPATRRRSSPSRRPNPPSAR